MQEFTEGSLTFKCDASWRIEKYDEWAFYRNQFQSSNGGNKAVDRIIFDGHNLWLLEIKDYRQSRREKDIEPWLEVALKVRDSLAGLYLTAVNGSDEERKFAILSRKAGKLRIVFHFEQPKKHSKLFPRSYDLADVQQKLKSIVRAIDPHPLVVEIASAHRCPWQVY